MLRPPYQPDTATVTNPVHSYTSAGYYSVTLEAMTGAEHNTVTKTNYITATSGGSAATLLTTTIGYTYDPLQRLTGATASGATTYTFAYAYDAANRLTSVNGLAYTWDNNPTSLHYGDSLRSR